MGVGWRFWITLKEFDKYLKRFLACPEVIKWNHSLAVEFQLLECGIFLWLFVTTERKKVHGSISSHNLDMSGFNCIFTLRPFSLPSINYNCCEIYVHNINKLCLTKYLSSEKVFLVLVYFGIFRFFIKYFKVQRHLGWLLSSLT